MSPLRWAVEAANVSPEMATARRSAEAHAGFVPATVVLRNAGTGKDVLLAKRRVRPAAHAHARRARMSSVRTERRTTPLLADDVWDVVRSEPVPSLPNWRYAGGPPMDDASPVALPCVIYFALTAEQSLELAPFNQLVRLLLRGGDMSSVRTAANAHPKDPARAADMAAETDRAAHLRVLSVTLPYHGDMAANENALAQWAARYQEGADVVSFFTRKASEALDSLVERGHVDPNHVYVAGLSRGGLLACHLAMRSKHISTVLAFSPVTRLTDLQEFKHFNPPDGENHDEHTPLPDASRRKVEEVSLLSDRCVDGLSECTVRVYSGNADTRVGTRNCFDLSAALADRAREKNIRSPPHEYIMYCSLGRDGHGTSGDVFAVGARWLLRKAGLRD